MIDFKKLIALSRPLNDEKDWLANAEAGVDYLLSQIAEDETIIFASLPSTFLHAVLAPRENVSPPDRGDLLNATVMQDVSWGITYTTGGGEPDRVYLASPLDHPHCKSLESGEILVVRRHFDSVDKGKRRTEVSQKLTHALNLYWLDEESAFWRFLTKAAPTRVRRGDAVL